MCKERKYASYKVVVTRNNGEREEITFKGVTGSDFKAMREAYSDYKEKVTPDSNITNIDFCGVSKDGKMNVMWNKPYEKKEESKTSYLNTDNPIEAILENLEYLNSKSEKYNDIVDFYDNADIPLLHEFEDATDEELMELGTKVRKMRQDRRKIKNKNIAIEELNNSPYSIKNLINKFSYVNRLWIGDITCREKAIENYKRIHTYYEIEYNTEDEKKFLLSKLKEDGWNKILDLDNGYIGFSGNNNSIENFNYDKIKKENNYKVTESTLETNCIKTITFNQKFPKENKKQGTCIQIKYITDKQKMKIINDYHDKYERCETLSDKNIVRLMYRIA